MKKQLLQILFLLILSQVAFAATIEYFSESNFRTAVPGYSLIDFENYASGTVLNGTEYQSSGVTIVNTYSTGVKTEIYNPASAFNNIYPWNTNGLYGDRGTIYHVNFDFNFSTPMTAAGLWLMDAHWEGYTIQFLTSTSTVISQRNFGPSQSAYSAATSPNGGYLFFYGITTDSLISKIRVIDTQVGEWIAIDNIHFGQVPEVSSLLLLCIAGLACFLRKKL